WRSDPHAFNGSASTKMDPRGDWLAAYWLARLSELGSPTANLSPRARAPIPYTLGEQGGGGGGGAGGGAPTGGSGGGCGCRVASDAEGSPELLAAMMFGAALARRRRRRR